MYGVYIITYITGTESVLPQYYNVGILREASYIKRKYILGESKGFRKKKYWHYEYWDYSGLLTVDEICWLAIYYSI